MKLKNPFDLNRYVSMQIVEKIGDLLVTETTIQGLTHHKEVWKKVQ